MDKGEMPEMKPHADFFVKTNPVKGKEVGNSVTITVSGKLSSISQSQDKEGYHVSLDVIEMRTSSEEFKKMSPEERRELMKKEVESKE